MKKIWVILLVFLFNINVQYSSAESIKKFKYGKVSIEELKMTSYDKDASADAVVLYQYSEFQPNTFSYSHYQKIKILKKTGTYNANLVFWGRLKSRIKGISYNIEGDKIVKTKLSNEAIFEEKVVGNIYRTRIAMPNVKEGTVFEIMYTQDGLPNSIEIQRFIPVLYSVVILPKHPNVDFDFKLKGNLAAIRPNNDTWIYKDLAAFVNEPYLVSDKDYRIRMEIEINKLVFTNFNNSIYSNHPFSIFIANFATSWKDVTKSFNENPFFGKRINMFTPYINSLADSIKSISSNEEELTRNAFETIKRIKWNGQETCYTEGLKDAFEFKTGNSADINLNLLILLKKLGLEAYPVLFSTRSNGKVSMYSPTIMKFNYVIIGVDLSSGTKYLDATEEFAPMGILPERLSECLGHPLNEKKRDCSVFLRPEKKDKKTSKTLISVNETGRTLSEIEIIREDYNAIDNKRILKSKTDINEYINDKQKVNYGWTIKNYLFENFDNPYLPFIEKYTAIRDSSTLDSDFISIKPFAFLAENSNPFVRDKRINPISFPVEIEHKDNLTIEVAPNYIIKEIPKDLELANSDKTIHFSYKVKNDNGVISISTSFVITKLNFSQTEYNKIRELYDKMIQKLNESVIIQKA